MACNDGPSRNWAGADIHRQWGCQQDILVFIEFEQVGALKVIVAHTIGQAKGICERDGQLDEHATGVQGGPAGHTSSDGCCGCRERGRQ
jgi:hypothetical protein